jgi:hypothetical protein
METQIERVYITDLYIQKTFGQLFRPGPMCAYSI